MKSIACTILGGLLAGSMARAPAKGHEILVPISPECKSMFYGPQVHGRPDPSKQPDTVSWDTGDASPLSFFDPRSNITLYVESDGRHVAAFKSDGTLLWVRDPFADAKLCPYRTPRPVIRHLGVAAPPMGPWMSKKAAERWLKPLGMDNLVDQFVAVSFDSSQFGVIDETNGNFLFLGQN